ncbi:hypothetical protein D9615_007105 [Tricholomella constricta]|uniref:Uncharacterized protein n=1 Tax=Tricholomella constricta TaxID=117010 RepID=A0A8H5M280_9AGAR|nr:hypothetical protein D9615_007105 [Tricholomella constricta]
MESLNLHTLANSLPTAQQNAEKELSNNFKAAALSITTLYRSSRKNSKRAYNAGYAAACQDLLTMIQQGVSLNPSASSHDPEQGGMTIGRVMDWTEARLEAIKSREEEEDEEEEREKEKEGGRSKAPTTVAGPKPDNKTVKVTSASTSHPKDQPASLPTPNSPPSQLHGQLPSEPSSPSPPPHATLRPIQRPIRSRPSGKGELSTSYTNPVAGGLDFITDGLSSPPPSSASSSDISIPIAAGAKRRHAMMMMLDSSTPPVTIGSSSTPHSSATGVGNSVNSGNHGSGSLASRRRTRSSRNLALQQNQNQNLNLSQTTSDAMDVEDDNGRERKRVARR